ncbi:MAG: HigA family addiction module antidote protein [Candidatus Moeniiplasma glomeromycotorum]|nr:HigA family addiction module antidote protein [Candidatus Moeniiplasma glomeromycotorum]
MAKKKLPPIHPGEILREELLKPYRISSKKLAQEIKVEEKTIQEIIKEQKDINADLSYRLGLYFGFREDYWLDLQKHYELECWKDKLAKRVKKEIRPYQPTINASHY